MSTKTKADICADVAYVFSKLDPAILEADSKLHEIRETLMLDIVSLKEETQDTMYTSIINVLYFQLRENAWSDSQCHQFLANVGVYMPTMQKRMIADARTRLKKYRML